MLANCFSSMLLDAPSPTLCDGFVFLLRPRVEGSPVSARLRPPRASSLSLASVSRVAVLLPANSALIQKLFYAVKRTCDKQGGGKGVGKDF